MSPFESRLPARLLWLEREPLPLIDIVHALHIARDFANNAEPQPLVQLWVGYLLSCLGGTLLTALVLGQPISWLANDVTFGVYCAVFLLTLTPWARPTFRRVANLPLLRHVISAGDDLSWANSVANLGVQRALQPLHSDSPIRNATCAALVCGVLSGCGGGLLRSSLGFNRSVWTFSSPLQFTRNPWPLRFSATMAIIYYALTNPHGKLPYDGVPTHEAKWIIISLSIACNTLWTAGAEMAAALKAIVSAAPVHSDSPTGKKQKKKKQAQAVQTQAQVQPLTDDLSDDESPPPSATSRSRPNAKKNAQRK